VRRIALLSLAVFALVVLAGCGAASDQTQEQTLTPAQVRQTFKQATGRPLEPTAVSDPAWDQLGYGLDMPQSLVDRYGIFNVYVGKPGKSASLASFFKDKDTDKPLARSTDGIYWELDSQSKTWVAYKRYGGNVVVWFSGSKNRPASASNRLDSILMSSQLSSRIAWDVWREKSPSSPARRRLAGRDPLLGEGARLRCRRRSRRAGDATSAAQPSSRRSTSPTRRRAAMYAAAAERYGDRRPLQQRGDHARGRRLGSPRPRSTHQRVQDVARGRLPLLQARDPLARRGGSSVINVASFVARRRGDVRISYTRPGAFP
jgi:hypothetical protein